MVFSFKNSTFQNLAEVGNILVQSNDLHKGLLWIRVEHSYPRGLFCYLKGSVKGGITLRVTLPFTDPYSNSYLCLTYF